MNLNMILNIPPAGLPWEWPQAVLGAAFGLFCLLMWRGRTKKPK
jgi:hypothetical protein